jgi:hypothetical protein
LEQQKSYFENEASIQEAQFLEELDFTFSGGCFLPAAGIPVLPVDRSHLKRMTFVHILLRGKTVAGLLLFISWDCVGILNLPSNDGILSEDTIESVIIWLQVMGQSRRNWYVAKQSVNQICLAQ